MVLAVRDAFGVCLRVRGLPRLFACLRSLGYCHQTRAVAGAGAALHAGMKKPPEGGWFVGVTCVIR